MVKVQKRMFFAPLVLAAALVVIPAATASADAISVSNCSSSQWAKQTVSLASAGAIHEQRKDINWQRKTVASAGTSFFKPTLSSLKGSGTDLAVFAASHGGFWFNCES